MERTGPALIDVGTPFGTPFGAAGSLRDDGAFGVPPSAVGYAIVEAVDLDGARELTVGPPFLGQADGSCTVEMFEMLTMDPC